VLKSIAMMFSSRVGIDTLSESSGPGSSRPLVTVSIAARPLRVKTGGSTRENWQKRSTTPLPGVDNVELLTSRKDR